MPRFQIEDSQSGRTMVIEGDAPPTEQDAEELFASYKPEPPEPSRAVPLTQKLRDKSARKIPTTRDVTSGGPRQPVASAAETFTELAEAPGEMIENFVTPLAEVPRLSRAAVEKVMNLPAQLAQDRMEMTPDDEPTPVAQAIMKAAPTDKTVAIATGIQNEGANLASFFTSPLGIATLGTGALPKVVQRGVALAFAAQMASQTPQLAAGLGEELGKPEQERDYQKIAELITAGGANTLFAAAGGAHGLRPGPSLSAAELLAREVAGAKLPVSESAPLEARTPANRGQGSETYAPNAQGEPPNIGVEKAANYSLRPTPRERVTVPETPAEQRETAIAEIRRNDARTIRQIQELFPKAELSRERARELRDAAFPELAKPEMQGPPKPWEEFAAAEATEPPTAKTENVPEAGVKEASPPASEQSSPWEAGQRVTQEIKPAEQVIVINVDVGRGRSGKAAKGKTRFLTATSDDMARLQQAASESLDGVPREDWPAGKTRGELVNAIVSEALAAIKDPASDVVDVRLPGGALVRLRTARARQLGITGKSNLEAVSEIPETKSPAVEISSERELPRPDEIKKLGLPTRAAYPAVEYHINQDIIDSGKHPNGKKATPKEIAGLRERQKQVVENFNQAAKKAEPAKATETPAKATAKVQEHVTEVATGEKAADPDPETGARGAKEIKSELVERLEKAIAEWEPKFGEKNITIEIPGDGTFTIKNTLEALNEVLARAKKLNTDSGAKPPARRKPFQENNYRTLEFTDWTDPKVIPALEAALPTRPELWGALQKARQLQGLSDIGPAPTNAKPAAEGGRISGPELQIPGGQFVAKTRGEARKLAEAWARENIVGKYLNAPTGWTIEVGKNGINKALSQPRQFSTDHIEAIAAIPELLRRATLKESRPDRANDPNIKAIHIFQAPLRIGGERYQIKLTIKETSDGKRFYDHSLLAPENKTGSAGTSAGDAGGSAPRSPQAGPQAESISIPPKPQGEGGSVSARASKPGETPATAAPKKVSALANDFKRLQANTAPQTIDAPARYVGNVLRELNAKFANEMLRADHALQPFRADFDRTPVPKDWQYDESLPLPRNFAFVDAYEGGRGESLTPTERRAVETFKAQNADWIERVHALGTGALKTFYENYFPHIWDDPARAKQIIGTLLVKRPLEGPKSFLKQRTHELFTEALKAGLRPVHDNPVDLWLLKKREVERYILAHSFINETKAAGVLKFVHSFSRAPDGYTMVNDPAFTVWGPPSIKIREAFDDNQRTALLDLLKYLRTPFSRLAKLREAPNAWGLAYPPPFRQIKVKLGSTEATAWHELGHQMDWAFPELRERLKMRGNSPLAKQLRALADLRAEGQEVTGSHRAYLHETPEKMAEIFKAYIHAPELFKETAPDVWRVVNKWLDENTIVRQKLDAIKPRLTYGSEVTEVPLNGMLKLGSYYLPDAAARVMNNFLSPGLNPHLWYRGLREASNLLNGIQLGMSAFHLGFTSLDAATSRLSVGIEDAWHGEIARAFKTAASVPMSPLTNIIKGAKVRAEVLKPGSQHADIQAIAHALEAGGGRVGQDAFWRSNFTRRMLRAIRSGTASGYLSGALQAPFALFEQTVRPIMEYVVPRQKLGVFADMAQREIQRLGPDAEPEEIREAMRKVWDSVDNRMGQLVYDNLFYNRWIKDVALLSFRAYGWQLGKYREGFGAMIDTGRGIKTLANGKKPELTHRMAYAMALPLLVGTLGAMVHYLMTGRRPEGQDYFMPQTGELDDKGNPVRLNFPSYLKDVMAYSQHPVTSFGHSLNPLVSSIFDLLENKDFYDVEIRHPDDPLWQQGSDVAAFVAKQFVPFSVSGAMKMRDDAAPIHKQILPFFGITPAPSRMTMTPAQELSADLMADAMPSGARTREQFDRSKLIKEIVRGIKTGDSRKTALFAEAIASGKLQPDATSALVDRLKYTPLQFQVFHLNADAAMRVWRIASPKEREELHQIMAQKIVNTKTLTPDKKRDYIEELQSDT